MKLKLLSTLILSMGILFMVSCKGKPKDADIQAAVTTALQSTPGVSADVKDGVVTLSGAVATEADKDAAAAAAKVTQGVKSVVNNVTVTPPPPPPAPEVTADDALKTSVAAIVKDFPGIQADVKDGVITITGEQKADRWKKLKMALDALKPKKVDASGLKVK